MKKKRESSTFLFFLFFFFLKVALKRIDPIGINKVVWIELNWMAQFQGNRSTGHLLFSETDTSFRSIKTHICSSKSQQLRLLKICTRQDFKTATEVFFPVCPLEGSVSLFFKKDSNRLHPYLLVLHYLLSICSTTWECYHNSFLDHKKKKFAGHVG